MECDRCPGVELEVVKGNEPWTIDHLQCPVCDGTYPLEDDKR